MQTVALTMEFQSERLSAYLFPGTLQAAIIRCVQGAMIDQAKAKFTISSSPKNAAAPILVFFEGLLVTR
ncbi:hypothetical protein [Croceicoccus mobilis]|uniref:Uncharacterized protein n=1 Tax=Croceicoccus mobilis TaxID=1703339 RepID=A0A917DZV8_9SPHN|nr:hypothetical protein [Croceicoccus mobilis]GGD83338.1 hypothetical protein GCM10010990_36790 [Croceicoccus mobilis]